VFPLPIVLRRVCPASCRRACVSATVAPFSVMSLYPIAVIDTIHTQQSSLGPGYQYLTAKMYPKTVFCTHDTSNSRVNYASQGTFETSNIYGVTLGHETYPGTQVRIDSQNGTMIIAQSRNPSGLEKNHHHRVRNLRRYSLPAHVRVVCQLHSRHLHNCLLHMHLLI
jgi:hypothetical protein